MKANLLEQLHEWRGEPDEWPDGGETTFHPERGERRTVVQKR